MHNHTHQNWGQMYAIGTDPDHPAIQIADMESSGIRILDVDEKRLAEAGTGFLPISMAAIASVNPQYAKALYPSISLPEMIALRPTMDGHEAQALAFVGGKMFNYDTFCNEDKQARLFILRLLDLMERQHLWSCFTIDPARTVQRDRHRAIRPRGALPAEDGGMAAFARAYEDLSAQQQVLVASIISLYTGRVDNDWCHDRSWTDWHAADALSLIRTDRGLWADWLTLLALYPGW